MSDEFTRAIDLYPEIKQYLTEIPRDLWYIFLPSEVSQFADLSAVIKGERIKQKERDYIIELRRKYGLPFRPNASIEETIKRVRLIRWQRKKQLQDQGLEDGAENSSADRIDPDEELI
jgi:hypothetical protein